MVMYFAVNKVKRTEAANMAAPSLSNNMCSRAQIREPQGSLRGSAAAAR